jgi:hypothetical protein
MSNSATPENPDEGSDAAYSVGESVEAKCGQGIRVVIQLARLADCSEGATEIFRQRRTKIELLA